MEADGTKVRSVTSWDIGPPVVTWIGAAVIAGGYAFFVGHLLTI